MAQIKPKADAALMASGMRNAAKPLAGLAEVLEGVHVAGSVTMTVPAVGLARLAHVALAEASERVRFSGPYGSGKVHITHDFGIDRYDIARLEVTLNVPPDVADEITPNWRTVVAAGSPAGDLVGEAL
jgi:hypothetical protein